MRRKQQNILNKLYVIHTCNSLVDVDRTAKMKVNGQNTESLLARTMWIVPLFSRSQNIGSWCGSIGASQRSACSIAFQSWDRVLGRSLHVYILN